MHKSIAAQISAILLSLTSGVSAAADVALGTTATPKQATERKDALSFCYFADKAYSEGTVLEGRECKRRPTFMTNDRDNQPLIWQDVSKLR